VKSVDLSVGAELPPWTPPAVTRSDIVRYQGASGDFDPAHHSDEHARRFGYPGVFSLGMLHAGILASYVTRFFAPESIRLFRSRFVAVVYPGNVLTYQGKIADIRDEGRERWVDIELECRRAGDGVIVTQGHARIQLAH
jgi:acyl dehydratase